MWSGNEFTPSSSSNWGTQQNNQSAGYYGGNNILPLDSSVNPLSAMFGPFSASSSCSTSFFHPTGSPETITGADDFLMKSSSPEETFSYDCFNEIFNQPQTDSNATNDLFDNIVPPLPTLPPFIPDTVVLSSTGGAATVEPVSVSPPTIAGVTTAPLPPLPPAEKANQLAANDALFPWRFSVPLVADRPGASDEATFRRPIFASPQTTDAVATRSRPSSLSVQLPNSRLVNSGITVSRPSPVPRADQPGTSGATLLPPIFPRPQTSDAVTTGSRLSSLSVQLPNSRLVNSGITVSPPSQPSTSGTSDATTMDSVPSLSSVQPRKSRRRRGPSKSGGGLTNAAPQGLLRPPEGQALVVLSTPSADETRTGGPASERKAASFGLNNQDPKTGLESKSNGIQPLIFVAASGEDISCKIISAAKDEEALFILAATGDISWVRLLPAASSEAAVFEGGTEVIEPKFSKFVGITVCEFNVATFPRTYTGRFHILSLTGTLRGPKKGKSSLSEGQLNISLAGEDGRVVSGRLLGSLIAASPIQIIGGRYTPASEDRSSKPIDELIEKQVQAQVASMKVHMDKQMERERQGMQAEIEEQRSQLQTTNQRLETALQDLVLTRQQLTTTQNMILELSQRTNSNNAQPHSSRSAAHPFSGSSNFYPWRYRR